MDGLIRLEGRTVIAVSDVEAGSFLHGILTNTIDGLGDGQAVYAGLLTPQGKLLFDGFVLRAGDRYLIDIDRALAADFVKRLTFYKLRAKVSIELRSEAMLFADLSGRAPLPGGVLAFDDPRLPQAGRRVLLPEGSKEGDDIRGDAAAWLAHRLRLGLPEGGSDFVYGDCFPHDIAMDQLNGIAFAKGCYVGQEVVSRMRHRGTARRRPMLVVAESELPATPCDLTADGKTIGRLGSAASRRSLAEVRLDFAEEALKAGKLFFVGEQPVSLLRPFWATYGETFPVAAEG